MKEQQIVQIRMELKNVQNGQHYNQEMVVLPKSGGKFWFLLLPLNQKT
jgi:hypothetical protein